MHKSLRQGEHGTWEITEGSVYLELRVRGKGVAMKEAGGVG